MLVIVLWSHLLKVKEFFSFVTTFCCSEKWIMRKKEKKNKCIPQRFMSCIFSLINPSLLLLYKSSINYVIGPHGRKFGHRCKKIQSTCIYLVNLEKSCCSKIYYPFFHSFTFSLSLSQSVQTTSSSMTISVWMIALLATLPMRSNRSVCVAMLIVPRVTDQALMTVMCVATGKLSVIMESV